MPTTPKSPTVAQLHKKLQPIFNHYIRLRDKGKPCISCGKDWEEKFQAGHFIPETHYMTRYAPENVNGQCMQCNGFKRGNWPGYLKGMLDRWGAATVWLLIRTWGTPATYKRDQLLRMIDWYTNKVKEMEVGTTATA